jgi:hypothetical protein
MVDSARAAISQPAPQPAEMAAQARRAEPAELAAP